MLIVRIKQAECALADGRLDEAFEIARAEDVRRHRRGQKVTGKLARALAKRGADNLSARRIQQALTDCNKADKLGGNLPEIAELRQAICNAMTQKQHKHQQRSLKLARAKKHIENGLLSRGEQILTDSGDNDSEAEMLLEQAAVLRLQIDSAAAKAEQALERSDLESAIDIIYEVGATNGQNNKLAEIIARIRTLANHNIRKNLNDGRIDMANALLQRLIALGAESVETRELASAITQCRQAAELIEAGQLHAATQILGKLRTILPSAKWLETATSQAKQTFEGIDALHTGPLGLLVSNSVESNDITGEEGLPSVESGMKARFDLQVPAKFVLQIDGVGGFLVLRDRVITAGAISSSARPVLGLLAEPNVPVATIERADEDYFVRSQKPIYINDRPVTERLLADSDRIALSAKCRMKFYVPNAASTTAVLELDGARLARPDIHRIILMDRDILIGPGFNNHIRAERASNTVTLFIQNGKLCCRAKERVMVDGRVLDSRAGLAMDAPIKIGQISLVLAKVES